jgi:sec-independent protein translocase protein TatC
VDQSVKHLHSATTVSDHIRELQMRFIVSAVALVISGLIVYAFYGPILTLLSSPLKAPLYYSSPAGSFTFVMRICFTGALIITIPVIVFNLIMFVRPAFTKFLPMKRVLVTTGFSTALAIVGAGFAFYCILPGTLSFFKGFQVTGLNALISADNYLGFVTNIIIMFVIVFQIPLLVMFIDIIKPLQPRKLIKMEKWVVLGSLVVALLAPFTYDLVTSLLIALPIIVLYNLSIVMVVVRHAKVSQKNRSAINAMLIKPISTDLMAISALSIDEQIFDNLADELASLEKPRLVSNITLQGEYMDIKSHNIKPETVAPAAWVSERKARRAELSRHVHVFSDIRCKPRINRALA